MNEQRTQDVNNGGYPPVGYPPKQEAFNIRYYIGVISKRRWLIILPFLAAVAVGIVLAVKLPKIYSAKTLILIQPQRVPEEYVQPVVSAEIESRINTISQQIMSRTNLEKIIERFNLFSGPSESNMYLEDKIEDLRRRISVELFSDKKSSSSTEAFSISFKGKIPENVMNITNALAESYIEENLKIREEEAVGTSDFLEDQLISTRVQLEELERRLESFRTRHMGGLPEQLESNLRILDRLQMLLNEKNENLRDARNRLMALSTQLSETEVLQRSVNGFNAPGTDTSALNPYAKIQEMREELAELRTRYTEYNPDVVRLKKRIEDFELRTEIEGLEKDPEIPDSSVSESSKQESSPWPIHPLLAQRRSQLMQQRHEAELEIEKLKAELEELNKQINHYQQLVDDTPKKEHELMSLKRDYENLQRNYNSLLDRKMQAQIAVNLEKNKKGEQFRILDRAKLPVKPSEPDMKKLFLLTIAAGLGIGGGIVFSLEFMNNSIKKRKDIDSELGLPVLAAIPVIYSKKQRAWRKTNLVLTFFSILFAIALCGFFALISLMGTEKALDAINSFV